MASTIKVNNIQNQCGANIINESANTITIGASGDTITLACGASQTGFGRTGTVDWDTTAKTASFTAVSGEGYFCNTTSSAFTATLPAGSAGAIVSFADYAATWQTNNLTVSPDGTDKIGGVNTSVTLNTKGQSVTFVYIDSTQGWLNTMDSTSNVRGNPYIVATGGTETTCGDYKIHTFTGPGTFCVTNTAVCSSDNVVDYLVIAGGGGGGVVRGSGAGAGGYRESSGNTGCYTASPLATPTGITVTATAFPITVGGGGVGGVGPNPPVSFATNGSNSVFSTITSAGGGRGASSSSCTPDKNGGNGGSGGGSFTPGGSIGSGNTPPVSPPQGNNGGAGSGNASGGGGGAGANGGDANPTTGGNGATGVTTSINGSPVTRAGGGGGGLYNSASVGSGGAGGGGAASPGSGTPYVGEAGTANTGGGGGGNSNLGPGAPGPGGAGGAGGSGIVIIRYKYQ